MVRANHCIIAEDCGDSSFYSNDLYPFGWGFSERSKPCTLYVHHPWAVTEEGLHTSSS